MRLLSAILIAASVALAGCGGGNGDEAAAPPPPPPPPPPPAAGESVEVELAEVDNSGYTGKATLEDTPEGVHVVLELTSGRQGRHPAHIHVGTCPEPQAYPTWSLPDVTEGKSETVLGTGLSGEPEPTLADLRAEDYAINVHKSSSAADVYIACGDIPKA